MEQMEKNVEKQLIIRTFEPDMTALKATAKQLAGMQDVTLNLYGQAGEVLIVVTARAYAPAAATELTENVAEQFESELGDAVYGRGKGSLAYFAAGELMESEAEVVAADDATGALLAEEFSHTKRGNNVFDFGEGSYSDSRVAGKIKAMAAKNYEKGNVPQMAAARAVAAAKCAHAEYGVSIAGAGEGETLYLAVAYKGYVYMRSFGAAPDAGKRAALAALDLVRRLTQKMPADGARVFRANTDFDWDDPIEKRPGSRYTAPIIVLAVLLVALGIACWYFFTHFTAKSKGDTLAVSASSSVKSAGQSAASPAASAAASTAPSAAAAPAASAPASSAAASSAASSAATSGAVRPFANN